MIRKLFNILSKEQKVIVNNEVKAIKLLLERESKEFYNSLKIPDRIFLKEFFEILNNKDFTYLFDTQMQYFKNFYAESMYQALKNRGQISLSTLRKSFKSIYNK